MNYTLKNYFYAIVAPAVCTFIICMLTLNCYAIGAEKAIIQDKYGNAIGAFLKTGKNVSYKQDRYGNVVRTYRRFGNTVYVYDKHGNCIGSYRK